MEKEINKTTGKVVGIVANLVMVEVDGPVSQNEICFILLKAEQTDGGSHKDNREDRLCSGF
jgi:V/A-type H+/Na+-transporting ATPase subunit A